MDNEIRSTLKYKKRIVIKIGTSTITHRQTGNIDLEKLEKFVRILTNIRNRGQEVIVVSSGAIGIGRKVLGVDERPQGSALRQACAAVGQGRLMMLYEKLFGEYSQLTAQILLTKETIMNEECRREAKKAFAQLLEMHVVPIVNENDAISVDEEFYGVFGDNDAISAHVAELVEADLLIMLSDIEGLYTDDPRQNPKARFVHTVNRIDKELEKMGKGSGSDVGTGGMGTKIAAAKLATAAGVDMVIANGRNIYAINDIIAGKKVGTLFLSIKNQHAGGNELAPEREQYRRAGKRKRKDGKRDELHGITGNESKRSFNSSTATESGREE